MCAVEEGDGHGKVLVFGGCGAIGRLNDLWSFDSLSSEWTCLHAGGTSEAPVPRGGSCLVASADGARLALLFGFSGAQQGDVAVFDRGTSRWRVFGQDDQKGDVPTPRSVLAATAAPGTNDVLLFGGESLESDLGHAGAGEFTADLYILDLESMSWRRLETTGPAPEPRGWGGMAALDSNRMVLFGGLNAANERLGDAWKLTVE